MTTNERAIAAELAVVIDKMVKVFGFNGAVETLKACVERIKPAERVVH